MYANFVEGVVRFYTSSFPDQAVDSPDEVHVFRTTPENDQIEPAVVTQDMREWLLSGPHSHFTLEERRHYADVGAESSSVSYVLDLLGSGVAGVAVSEIYRHFKERVGGHSDDAWQRDRFAHTSDEEHRDAALAKAERLFGFGRGKLELIDLRREEGRVVIRAEHPDSGERFRIELRADETESIYSFQRPRSRSLGGGTWLPRRVACHQLVSRDSTNPRVREQLLRQ